MTERFIIHHYSHEVWLMSPGRGSYDEERQEI